MSDSIWWADEPWWERKVLPLGFITLSFRQLGTLAFAFVAAFLVSLPFTFPIAGLSFGGRAAVFCVVFGVGYVISNRRVKLIPVEVQALYFLRTEGVKKAWKGLRRLVGREKLERDPPHDGEQPPIAQEGVLEVTSFVKIICHRSQRTNGRDDDSVERWAVARDILLT
jgi:hypothetical protein